MSKYVYVVEMTDLDTSVNLLEVFSNKKNALEYFKKLAIGRRWVETMPVPLDIFLEHCKKFEDTVNGDEDFGYLWKDYLGYTADDWETSLWKVLKNRHHPKPYKVNLWKQTLQQNKEDNFIRELLCCEEVPELVIKFELPGFESLG